MEGEISNFIMVWSLAMALLCYSYTIGKIIPQGKTRLLALSPPTILLFILPLRLTSMHLGAPSSFFLAWLSTFNLLLFSFGKGSLSSNPPLSLPHFLLLACLPIKFQPQHHNFKSQSATTTMTAASRIIESPQLDDDHINRHLFASPQPNHRNKVIANKKWQFNYDNYRYTIMVILFASCVPLYEKKENFHPKFTMLLYTLHMYTGIEISFAFVSAMTRKFLQIEMEPQFDEPYLSTSLQDFWGRRWNMVVTRILHPAVYVPVVNACSHVIGRKWAPLPAVVATFTVSGMMHEVVFYYIKHEKRTWERWEPSWGSICFFILHGVCLALEIGVKKVFFKKKWSLPRVVSRTLTVAFVAGTGVWLFVPALAGCGAFVKAQREFVAVVQFVKNVYTLMS
ncbi:acyl-CoA--sterol O-acyltransferase 1-like [Lotus japonicus]|uniref:acyl-CoA--sterol O-acyltransferase 1-like n=1 Tax=Lotus japonicus TaxID=34305 RepID=UPI00258BD00F|nr:acyl-CoA--sterol O-acyltransferase 1-like [Lotus japonicus]